MIPPTVEWCTDRVRYIDQRKLPDRLEICDGSTVNELCEAIRTLAIRGAPALGAAGAMGIALAHVRGDDMHDAARRLVATRPTAVNLAWGVRLALAAADPVAEAVAIARDDVERNMRIGEHGRSLMRDGMRVLTHCNTGSLACVGWGTALGVVRSAHVAGLRLHVWVDETRPLLQGARLTAWECEQLGIPYTLVADSMAATLMRQGLVDCVIVGADRIADNGDVANKVGTYQVAVAAHHHEVPFYVAAPLSTFDHACASGDAIEIEQRDPIEVTEWGGRRTAPISATVRNDAFDITPAALISAYVTEEGVRPGSVDDCEKSVAPIR